MASGSVVVVAGTESSEVAPRAGMGLLKRVEKLAS